MPINRSLNKVWYIHPYKLLLSSKTEELLMDAHNLGKWGVKEASLKRLYIVCFSLYRY